MSFFQDQPVTFSEEAFLAQKPGSPLQAFHRRAVHLQLFKQVRQSPEGGAGAGGARIESAWQDFLGFPVWESRTEPGLLKMGAPNLSS